MSFDLSCIHQFSMPGDNTNTYCMVDEAIVAEALEGLTTNQKTVVNSYRWTPTEQQLADGLVSTWGGDPVAVYFKASAVNMKTALHKRWREPS